MVLSAAAGEPLLIVGPPGTAKSDLVLKFCQGLALTDEYFEYMLTKFTEPSEILGPIDIELLKEGRFVRKVGGKLPTAKVAFLDEIFKSNSAILNVLLTIINERKFYQDGRPEKVPLEMLFAATNEVPEFKELDALKDRFVLKVESGSVQDEAFDELIEKGVQNETMKVFGQRPWEGRAGLEDFRKIRRFVDLTIAGMTGDGTPGEDGPVARDREKYFPRAVSDLFRRVLKTIAKEEKLFISDRKVVKLYKILRMRAFLFHGGEVRKEDLVLLRHIGERATHFRDLPEKVDRLLGLG
jgi:MoxR-like ATPase